MWKKHLLYIILFDPFNIQGILSKRKKKKNTKPKNLLIHNQIYRHLRLNSLSTQQQLGSGLNKNPDSAVIDKAAGDLALTNLSLFTLCHVLPCPLHSPHTSLLSSFSKLQVLSYSQWRFQSPTECVAWNNHLAKDKHVSDSDISRGPRRTGILPCFLCVQA